MKDLAIENRCFILYAFPGSILNFALGGVVADVLRSTSSLLFSLCPRSPRRICTVETNMMAEFRAVGQQRALFFNRLTIADASIVKTKLTNPCNR